MSPIHTATATLPPRLLIYGAEGVGKTTFAASFPAPVFLQTEDGCPAGLEIVTFGVLAKYDDVITAITALGHETFDRSPIINSASRIPDLRLNYIEAIDQQT